MPSRESKNRAFKLGNLECWVLHDGSRTIGSMTNDSARRFIFGDAPESELDDCLKPYGGLDSSTPIQFNYLLVKGGGHVTLIDAGCGDQTENDKHPDEPAGLLIGSLGDVGLSATDVDTVIISHCHWDHFGGAVVDGEVAFPDAEYVMSEKEAEHIRTNVKGWALDYLRLIGDKVRLVPDVANLSSGITVKIAPGHTPGIMVVEVSSNGETLVYTSDIIIHQAHIEHADWIPSFETNHITAQASRSNLIEEAYKRNLLLFVPHIPSVLGRLIRDHNGYKWTDIQIWG
jgi:glyoxylase-like metal-dependent hydrolase (beta-lactamase superfamily II)